MMTLAIATAMATSTTTARLALGQATKEAVRDHSDDHSDNYSNSFSRGRSPPTIVNHTGATKRASVGASAAARYQEPQASTAPLTPNPLMASWLPTRALPHRTLTALARTSRTLTALARTSLHTRLVSKATTLSSSTAPLTPSPLMASWISTRALPHRTLTALARTSLHTRLISKATASSSSTAPLTLTLPMRLLNPRKAPTRSRFCLYDRRSECSSRWPKYFDHPDFESHFQPNERDHERQQSSPAFRQRQQNAVTAQPRTFFTLSICNVAD